MVVAAGSVVTAVVAGAWVVTAAASGGAATVLVGATSTSVVDAAVGAGSGSIVSGTLICEHAASISMAPSQGAHVGSRLLLPRAAPRVSLISAALAVLPCAPTAPWRSAANGSRTCSKDLLLNICSRATAAIRPNIHHTGRLSREGGTLPP